MTKKERQQLREAKGQTKRLDKVADRYAAIALGIEQKNDIGYTQNSLRNKQNGDDDKKSKVKPFKTRKNVTKDWERVWCEFCKHPNPKNLMFCQLCDSNLVAFKE